MKLLNKKIKNKRGVTIVMALLFFLVATMVSSVLIGVSNTAKRKIIYDKLEQQALLTVSSLGEYIRDEIAKYEFQTVVVKTSNGKPSFSCTTTQGCDFEPLMDQIQNYAVNELFDSPFKRFNDCGYIKFRINIADSLGSELDDIKELYGLSDDYFGDVYVTVNVANAEYRDSGGSQATDTGIETLDITLELEGPVRASEDEVYKMSVYMKCNVLTDRNISYTETEDTTIVTETITSTYSWSKGVIERGIESNP